MFKIGNRVKVTNDGCTYTTYEDMAKKLKAKKWTRGNDCSDGDIGKIVNIDEGRYGYIALVEINNREVLIGVEGLKLIVDKRGHPRTKVPKVNFLLKYDLDEGPIEEFETMDQVKERIDYLVKNESSLKKDSMVVYEVKRKKVVSVQTKITMK